jgi:hypothetical protein
VVFTCSSYYKLRQSPSPLSRNGSAYASSAVWVRRAIAAAASVWVRLRLLAVSCLGCAVWVAAVLLVVLRHGGCFAIELELCFGWPRCLQADAEATERCADGARPLLRNSPTSTSDVSKIDGWLLIAGDAPVISLL